ncbi:MAG: hypothetical protein R6X25_09245 [Candidatus Krumholzibacteriia bacterium]
MSDIFQAVSRRSPLSEPRLDVTVIDAPLLFPRPDPEQAAEFEKLVTRILEFKNSPDGYALAFASNVAGEGTSFVSYNVARLLSTSFDRRTIWVDANFLSPHPRLASTDGPTLASYLMSPERVPVTGAGERLGLLPGGANLPTMRPELASGRGRQVLDALRADHEFVVVDCPPILDAVETSWLGTAADGMIVVVEARRLKSQVISHALESLARQQVNVVGTVLNRRRFTLPRVVYERL